MNTFFIMCCLLMVALVSSTNSDERKKREFKTKLHLLRGNSAHDLKRLINPPSPEDEARCKAVKPCFEKFGSGVIKLYKSNSGTLEECNALVDDMVKCLQDQYAVGKICHSCSTEAVANMFWAMESAGNMKKLICAAFHPGAEPCTDEISECVGECLEEEEESDNNPCRKCLIDLRSTLNSNHGCPMLKFLRESAVTFAVKDPLTKAYKKGCDPVRIQRCLSDFMGIKCRNSLAVKAVEIGVDNCMDKLSKDDPKCEPLQEMLEYFKVQNREVVAFDKMLCRVWHQAEAICPPKKS